jgi:hypothetical protein
MAEHSSGDSCCSECGGGVFGRPTIVEYKGQEIFLFEPAVCEACLLKLCAEYSVPCANCGGVIPPFSQVGVLKGDGGQNQYVHMTTACLAAGGAFHGYWGKGKLRDFVQIEAC